LNGVSWRRSMKKTIRTTIAILCFEKH
jgi:hypothetical protein